MLNTTTTAALVALAGLLAGCGGGMGQMTTVARGAADKGGLGSALDAPLAVGAEVRPEFKFSIAGAAAPTTHLLTARPDMLAVKDGLLVGVKPGVVAVLVATEGDTVIDFLHVSVRAPDRLALHGIDQGGVDLGPLTERLELVSGESMRLVPHVYAGPERLVGVATSTWTVEPPIAAVLKEGLPNRIRLVARSPGEATVTVNMLGKSSTLKLRVVP
jgi:hypothetical protein